MKEYKTVSIKIDAESRIEDQLNEFAKDGWSLVQVITKHLNLDNGCAEFIYILERNKQKSDILEKFREFSKELDKYRSKK